jgi:hypothetical protein
MRTAPCLLGGHEVTPTGRTVTSTGITILRIVDGKVVDDRFESGGPNIEEQLA